MPTTVQAEKDWSVSTTRTLPLAVGALIGLIAGLGLASSTVSWLTFLVLLIGGTVAVAILVFPAFGAILYAGSLWSLEMQKLPVDVPFLTAGKVIVLLTLVGWVVHMALGRNQGLAIHVPTPVLAVTPFVVWSILVSSLVAADKASAFRLLIGLVTLPVMMVVIVNVCRTDRARTWLLYGLLFSGFMTAVISLLETATQTSLTGVRLGAVREIVRGGTTVGTANYASVLLVRLVFVPLLFVVLARRLALRVSTLFVAALFLAAILFLQSRAAYLCLGFGALLLCLVGPRTCRRWATLGGILVLVVLVSVPVSRSRILTLFGYRAAGTGVNYSQAQASVSIRTRMLHAGADIIAAHPWTGIGINNTQAWMRKHGGEYGLQGNTVVLENSFLQAAAETGVPGFLLFCLYFAVLAAFLVHQVRNAGESVSGAQVTALGLGLLATLPKFLISTLFDDRILWVCLAAMVVLHEKATAAMRALPRDG